MVDVAMIRVRAGNGGNGKVSFRREKYVPKGGPDGGNGADGGSVYLVGERNLRTLDYFASKQKFEARNGEHGRARKQSGAKAEDMYIKVPQGCVVYEIDCKSDMQLSKNDLFALLRANKAQLEVIHRDGENPAQSVEVTSNKLQVTSGDMGGEYRVNTENNEYRIGLLGEIVEEGQEVRVAKGGRGGRGNTAFKGPTNTTPMEAESGGRGESKWLVLELKMLSDVGLIGLPNAGKSTLLSVLTAARPKIADYPFTTLEPNLGVMSSYAKASEDDRRDEKILSRQSREQELIIADIPGLIAGASKGKGLGDEFLRHVERCGLLVHVVALRPAGGDQLSVVSEQIMKDYETVRKELAGYHPALVEKPELVVVSKMDLVGGVIPNERSDQGITEFGESLKRKIRDRFNEKGVREVVFVSAATHEGLEGLMEKLVEA